MCTFTRFSISFWPSCCQALARPTWAGRPVRTTGQTSSQRPSGLNFYFHKLTLLYFHFHKLRKASRLSHFTFTSLLCFHFHFMQLIKYTLSHFISRSLLRFHVHFLEAQFHTFTFHFHKITLLPLSLSRAQNRGLQVHTFTSSFLRPFNFHFHFSLSQAHQSVQDSTFQFPNIDWHFPNNFTIDWYLPKIKVNDIFQI